MLKKDGMYWGIYLWGNDIKIQFRISEYTVYNNLTYYILIIEPVHEISNNVVFWQV